MMLTLLITTLILTTRWRVGRRVGRRLVIIIITRIRLVVTRWSGWRVVHTWIVVTWLMHHRGMTHLLLHALRCMLGSIPPIDGGGGYSGPLFSSSLAILSSSSPEFMPFCLSASLS